MSDVADRLRECRERSEKSFRQISAETGFSAGHLANVHNGKDEATLDMLTRLAPIYRTTVEWLRDGDERVSAWAEFQRTVRFLQASDPRIGVANRIASIIAYLEEEYPGHLMRSDIATYMDVSSTVLDRLSKDSGRPADDLVHLVSQISGVPVTWIELGALGLIGNMGLNMSVDEVRELLLLGAKAKAAGLSIDRLNGIVDALTK